MEPSEVVDVETLALALRELRLKYAILCHITGHSFHGRVTCLLCGLARKSDPTGEECLEAHEAFYTNPLPVERE